MLHHLNHNLVLPLKSQLMTFSHRQCHAYTHNTHNTSDLFAAKIQITVDQQKIYSTQFICTNHTNTKRAERTQLPPVEQARKQTLQKCTNSTETHKYNYAGQTAKRISFLWTKTFSRQQKIMYEYLQSATRK